MQSSNSSSSSSGGAGGNWRMKSSLSASSPQQGPSAPPLKNHNNNNNNSSNSTSKKKKRKRSSKKRSLRRMRISKEYEWDWVVSGLPFSVQERMSVQQLLLEGQIQKAREKLDQMDPLFLAKHAAMDFLLAKQELLELIKARNVVAALGFATKHLAPFGEKNPQFLQEIEHTMSLLAYENHKQAPLGYLLDQSQRRRVADEVNSAILRNQKQEIEPMLPTMVRQFRYMEDQLQMKIKRRPKGICVQSEENHHHHHHHHKHVDE